MKKTCASLVGMMLLVCVSTCWAGDANDDFAKGLQLAKLKKYQEALQHFRTAVKEEPTRASVYYNMGNVLFKLGEFPEAIRAYEEVVLLEPDDADAYYNIAMTYSVMDDMGNALEALEEVVRIRPNDGEAHYRLAMGYYSLRQRDKALAHLESAKNASYPVPAGLETAIQKHTQPPEKKETE